MKRKDSIVNNNDEKKNSNNAKALFEEEEKIANKEIENVKKLKPSKVGNIWEIRKRVNGGRKTYKLSKCYIRSKNRKTYYLKT